MTVKRVTDMQDVLRLVPIEIKLRIKEKSEVPVKDLLSFVQLYLASPYFFLVIIEEDEKIIGYIGMYFNGLGVTRNLHIWRMWRDPHRKDVNPVLNEIIENVKAAVRAKVVVGQVRGRGVKAFQRTWGFKPTAVVMERR